MKKKRFKENFTCFKLQSKYMKSIPYVDQFSHEFWWVFLLFLWKIIGAKYYKKSHPRNLICAKCQKKHIWMTKIKWMTKSWEWYSDISGFSLAKKQNSYQTYHFFMLKFCELIICEIKFAWKIVRKWRGIAYLVVKRWCM